MNLDDLDVYRVLIRVCNRYTATTAFGNYREFFDNLLSQYHGASDLGELEAWLDQKIPELFLAFGKRPEWIQDSDWAFVNGQPMIFVGQIDISLSENPEAAKLFHDDLSFYIFLPQDGGQSKVVIQVY
jgi:hypothetical protein